MFQKTVSFKFYLIHVHMKRLRGRGGGGEGGGGRGGSNSPETFTGDLNIKAKEVYSFHTREKPLY